MPALVSSAPGTPLPRVLVTTDNKPIAGHPSLVVTRKYVDPLVDIAGVLPLLLPPLGAALDIEALLEIADGIMLTGSPSNIEPHHYRQSLLRADSLSDPERDALVLPLIRAAHARGVPVFGICRGFQEANVALGGTLHQVVHEVAGMQMHHEDVSAPVETQYGPAHVVRARTNGRLANLLGTQKWVVNSMHGQGVDRLAPGLVAEARAEDGLVEAFAAEGEGAGFLLAVQWHPEWQARGNPVSEKLFTAFGDACRAYAVGRRAHG